jgi:hypothetical protein
MKSSSRSQTLEELLRANKRRLHLLEMQEARLGISADPSLQIEIEDLRQKIASIEQTLAMAASASLPSPAGPADPHAAAAAAAGRARPAMRRIVPVAALAVVLLVVAFAALARFSPGGTADVSPTAGRPAPTERATAAAAVIPAPEASAAAGNAPAQAPAVALTVAPPVNLTSSPGASTAPRLAFDPQNHLHLTWTDDPPQKKADRLYKRLAPGGGWSESENLTADYGDLKGSDWLLRAPDGRMCMFWYGGEASNHPFTWALRKRCLAQAGWSPPEAVHEGALTSIRLVPAYAPDGGLQTLASGYGAYQGIYFGKLDLFGQGYVRTMAFAIDANGQYHATWNNGEGLQYRSSTDGGQTWSKEEQLSDEAYGFLQEVLIADGQGRVHLLWGTLAGSQLYYQRWSAASGWETAILLTGEFSSGNEPALAVDGEGRAHAVWSGENGIFYARQVDDDTFAEPVQIAERGQTPVIALDAQNIPHIAWTDLVGQESDVFLTTAQ